LQISSISIKSKIPHPRTAVSQSPVTLSARGLCKAVAKQAL